ncbi:DEAD/DEAH box helicase family protein [Solibacillus sp. A46]|uniref:DEAD/DEAH box helicase family protein n=1 Tax=Solibacillus faecavium TaxID=2762221 RepID=A0ABR8XXF1_9BACL|nr:DEAD/DEAH box helicase family protein [Solibacillus faecavium]MBD8036622.1 DEAD/DEAH box helicase family protein [Solibacillus faecavium]
MKYLSEIITIKHFEEINNKQDYLLISNTGSGKTHLMLEKFVSWAKVNNKKVLYLYNRVGMKLQFGDYYSKRHDNLTIQSYQHYEKKYSDNLSYICQFNTDCFAEYDYILCDECQYFTCDSLFNDNTYVSFEIIKRSKAIRIFFSATPTPFTLISDYLLKDLRTIDLSGYTKKNIKKIIITTKAQFNDSEKFFLKKNKIIHFENDTKNIENLSEFYSQLGYKSTFISKANIEEFSKDILCKYDNDQENIPFDIVATTSVCETGMNFNISNDVIVSFPKFMNWTSLEQSASRPRSFNNNSVSMLYCIPHYTSLVNIFISNAEKLEYYKAKKRKLLKSAEFLKYTSCYDFKIAMLEYILYEIEEIMDNYNENSKKLLPYFNNKLNEIYPDAEIVILNELDMIDVEGYFAELMAGNDELLINMATILKIKTDLGIGPKTIKKKLKNIYSITPKRITSKKIYHWLIEKLQK